MKRLKHFLGWLFKYCPYGEDCPPQHPFKMDDHLGDKDTYSAFGDKGGAGGGGRERQTLGGGGC